MRIETARSWWQLTCNHLASMWSPAKPLECSLVQCVDCLMWNGNAVEISLLRRHAANFHQHSGLLAQLVERLQPAEERVSCWPL